MAVNYYRVLGVRDGASAAEIRQAYREAALTFHSANAANSSSDAYGQFSELAQAYSALSGSSTHGASGSRRVAPDAIFADSMTEWAEELREQGYSDSRIKDFLLLHGCPESVAEASSVARPAYSTPQMGSPIQADTPSTLPSEPLVEPDQPPAGRSPSQPSGNSDGNFVAALTSVAIIAAVVLAIFLVSQKSSTPQDATAVVSASTPTADLPPAASTPVEATTLGPYAFLSSIPEMQSPDTTQGTALRAAGSFRLPTGEALPSSDNGYFATKVALRIVLSSKKVLYLLQSAPVSMNQMAYECHACPVVVSSLMTNVDKSGVETAAQPVQDLGTMGGFGKYNFSTVALVELGRKRAGLVFEDGWMGMGEVVRGVSIYSIEPKSGLRKMGQFQTAYDNTNSGTCQSQKELCESYSIAVRFTRDSKSAWYPLVLSVTGTHKNNQGVVVPVDGTVVAHFNGKEYVADKPQGTAGSSPEAAESTDAASSAADTQGAQQ
ncbi:J domain-containing protein [Paraburkholderia sp. Ac-20336]|uniref:J domain-containing protein n=1 Tax=Paraburkholderia sp. Ac-20336 TaxID=2703886 RepID=UPI001981E529|nr:J domain-containing protein [Paraburkholderia sp. Ac-20336]MBN3801953.1 J domain-containing protein [Paraburkholderia sp. Ac-20336]